MKKQQSLFNQLKQCQTLKEIATCIPNDLYDTVTMLILGFWCFMPIGAMVITHVTAKDADLFMYLSCLTVGFLGIYITILRYLKVKTKRQLLRRETLPQIMLLAMLGWSLLASFGARDGYRAFIGDSYSHEGFMTYVAYAGVYGSALFLVKSKHLKRLAHLFLGVGVLLAVLTILQYSGYYIQAFSANMPLASVFHNTNHYGYYLVLTSLTAASCFIITSTFSYQLIYGISFILILMALIVNNTFGAYLGVLAGVIAIFIIFSSYYRKCFIKHFVPLGLFLATTLFVNQMTGLVEANFNGLESDVEKIVTDAEDSGNAGSFRWALWVAALDFIEEEPLFGYGPENLDHNYKQVGIDMLKPHNEYIQHAVSLGVPALIFYLITLGSIYLNAYLRRQQLTVESVMALCVVSGYLVSAFFGNTKFYVTPYFMILLAIAAQSYMTRGEREC